MQNARQSLTILVAEDDLLECRVLADILRKTDHYDVTTCDDGMRAWEILKGEDSPKMAILDWVMPGLEGIDICRKVRELKTNNPPYLILVTGKDTSQEIVAGLEAGANDYIIKPFDEEELKARVAVGARVLELQAALGARVKELEKALAQVKHLQGLLPICSYCKRIRNDHNYWEQVDHYITDHSNLLFSHGICPDCAEKVLKELDSSPDSETNTKPAE